MKFIDEFKNEYKFLSNFYEKEFNFRGNIYPTAEHAYQACKSISPTEKKQIQTASTPAYAKKLGRKCKIDPEFDKYKVSEMYYVVKIKFSDPELRQKLLDTKEDILIEGNWWGDTFWGVCNNKGENILGQLLMLIRSEIRCQ